MALVPFKARFDNEGGYFERSENGSIAKEDVDVAGGIAEFIQALDAMVDEIRRKAVEVLESDVQQAVRTYRQKRSSPFIQSWSESSRG